MEASQRVFGITRHGQPVHEYTLKNPATGVRVCVLDWGATVTRVCMPRTPAERERSDEPDINISLCRDTMTELEDRALNPYMGATVGRVANVTANASYSVSDGEDKTITCSLAQNFPDGHHLHGGLVGWDSRMWTLEWLRVDASSAAVCLSLHSWDGEEGFRGAVDARAIISLSAHDVLGIEYDLESLGPVPTPVNVCNHCYWSLTGGHTDVLGHDLTIRADKYVPSHRKTLIPFGHVADVDDPDNLGGAATLDFRAPRRVGACVHALVGRRPSEVDAVVGYNFSFLVKKDEERVTYVPPAHVSAVHDAHLVSRLCACAIVTEASTRRRLAIDTTCPVVHMYDSNYWTSPTPPWVRYGALCLETMLGPPDSANRAFAHVPRCILAPGERAQSLTVHALGSVDAV